MTDKLWVVVADSARARIFSAKTRNAPLIEIKSLEHPEGRMHATDLTSDLPGKDSDRTGAGKHSISASDPKQQEVINFGRKIAGILEEARTNNKFRQVALIAAPAFLGTLRDLLSAPLAKLVTCELDKNLTQLDAAVIRENLPDQLSRVNA